MKYNPHQLTAEDLEAVDFATHHYSPKDAIRRMLRKAEACCSREQPAVRKPGRTPRYTVRLGRIGPFALQLELELAEELTN